MNILLVDDDTTLAEVTAFALRRAGFVVDLAYDGAEALARWDRAQPDLLILDIQLPEMDGLTLCRLIRQRGDTPIIMLTVRNSDEDIVHGLEIGADDYLTKPFSPKQLIARARAVLRRRQLVPPPAQLRLGELTLDTAAQLIATPQGSVRLTGLEFRLLHFLLMHESQVVPTETIVLHVWGYSESSDRALLKQLIYRLRQKLSAAAGDGWQIETIAGVGYRLGAEERHSRADS
ncbi:MAG: response regulator transcription factor [Chloroflexales bacterium]|nr:response regulator transcription factor [Chloroflexales bacterium]